MSAHPCPGAHKRAAVSCALLALLAACGGGGDSTPPAPIVSRQASISYDFDNNGSTDAVETLRYDSAGRPASSQYVYSGDGLADRFNPQGTDLYTENYGYDSAGRLALIDSILAGDRVSFEFNYGSAGTATSADISGVFDGLTFSAQRAYGFSGSLLTDAQTLVGGVVAATDVYAYDGFGQRTQWDQTDATSGFTTRTTYDWNADGTLAVVRRDLDADGADVRYELRYAGGLQTSTVKTVGGAPFYTVTFGYDASNRLSQARFDRGSDGSVDAVWTLTWESGACQAVTLPEFDPLMDSVSGFGSSSDGTIDPCGP